MNFSFSEEQQALIDAVGRYIDNEYGFEARKQALKEPAQSDARHWAEFADLGLLGVNVAEAYGGLGGTAFESLIVMEAFGRGLVVESYAASAIGAVALIQQAGTETQRETLLPAIVSGELRFALAVQEPGSRYELLPRATRAVADCNDFVIDGAKSVALGGRADKIILAARTNGQDHDEAGVSIFCISADAPGLVIDEFPTLDNQRCAELKLNAVRVTRDALLGTVDQGYPALLQAVDRVIAALCAEAVGAMHCVLEMTFEHLRTRKQFGQTLGSQQVLQHRAVDLLACVERSRSMALYAASRVDSPDANERRRAISAAKAFVGRACRRVVKESIQMHGGIGMADELAVSHFARRLLCIDLTLGDSAYHTQAFSTLPEV